MTPDLDQKNFALKTPLRLIGISLHFRAFVIVNFLIHRHASVDIRRLHVKHFET